MDRDLSKSIDEKCRVCGGTGFLHYQDNDVCSACQGMDYLVKDKVDEKCIKDVEIQLLSEDRQIKYTLLEDKSRNSWQITNQDNEVAEIFNGTLFNFIDKWFKENL